MQTLKTSSSIADIKTKMTFIFELLFIAKLNVSGFPKISLDYEDDHEQANEYQREFRRPRTFKRARLPPGVMLAKQMLPDICTIGEKPEILDEDIDLISEGIVQNFEVEEYFRNNLKLVLWAIITEQPHKQPTIAILLMKVYSLDAAVGKTLVNFLHQQFQDSISKTVLGDSELIQPTEYTGFWNKAKLGLRFFSLLTPIISEDDILSLYTGFFDLATQLNNTDPEKRVPLAELIYFNTLIAVPQLFLFHSVSSNTLFSKVQNILSTVEQNFKVHVTQPLDLNNEFNNGSQVYEKVNIAQVIMKAVQDVLADDLAGIKNLYPDYSHLLTFLKDTNTEQSQGFNDPLVFPTIESLQKNIQLSDEKASGSVDGLWRYPRYTFELYQTNAIGEFETVPERTSFAGLLFHDILVDVIQSLEFNKDTVSEQVVLINMYFKPGVFSPKGLSISQLIDLRENDPNVSTLKLEDLAVETILSLVFKLPAHADFFYMYYYTLLVSICTASARSIAPVFGRAFRFYYSHLSVLDSELKIRFLDWFSFQMNNFNFSWKWNEWELDSQLYGNKKTFYNPKINFIKNLIKKELRLTSSPQEISDSLNEEFLQYTDCSLVSKAELKNYYETFLKDLEINDQLFESQSAEFVLLKEIFPFSKETQSVVDYFRKKERTIQELHGIIGKLESEYGQYVSNVDKLIVTLLTQAVIHAGSRSISHASNCVRDFKEDLAEVFGVVPNAQEKDKWVIEAIMRYWNSNSRTGLVDFIFNEYETNQSIGLVDSTFIESLFDLLQNEETETDLSLYQYVFEKVSLLANGAISQLNLSASEPLPEIPDFDYYDFEDPETPKPEISAEELTKYDLVWKMESSVSLIKTLIRKFGKKYSLLATFFKESINETTIPYDPVRNQLLKYLDEVSQL
ncbi:hypothetical protein ACO0QE_001377 [Hanseniaspora vineae]